MYSLNHHQILLDSINGSRETDEKSFEAMSVLSEKLENLKKIHRCFIDVEFSREVLELQEQESKLAIS